MNLYKYLCEITKQILFINKKSTKYPPTKKNTSLSSTFLPTKLTTLSHQPTN